MSISIIATTSGFDATREKLDQAVPSERDPRDNDRTSKTMEPIQRNPVDFRFQSKSPVGDISVVTLIRT